MTLSHWDYLSALQSHDFVLRTYTERHKRRPSARLIKQITANFLQAQEYYNSARVAAASVKPLLLYYGISSLSRGIILSLDPRQHEDTLAASHGLQPVRWKETLHGEIKNLLELEVTACRGTFTELAAATRNKTEGWFHIGPYPSRVRFEKTQDISEITNGDIKIGLGDCLSWIKQLSKIYQSVMGIPSNVFSAQIFYIAAQNNIPKLQADISMFRIGDINEADMRDVFRLSTEIPILHRDGTNWIQVPALWARITGGSESDLMAQMPTYDEDSGEVANVVRPIEGKYDIAPLLIMYLSAYILGMIVRYFPSIWMALLRNEKGDQAQPLLLSAMKVIEEGFLNQALRFLGA